MKKEAIGEEYMNDAEKYELDKQKNKNQLKRVSMMPGRWWRVQLDFNKQIVVVEESCLVRMWDENKYRQMLAKFQKLVVDKMISNMSDKMLERAALKKRAFEGLVVQEKVGSAHHGIVVARRGD